MNEFLVGVEALNGKWSDLFPYTVDLFLPPNQDTVSGGIRVVSGLGDGVAESAGDSHFGHDLGHLLPGEERKLRATIQGRAS